MKGCLLILFVLLIFVPARAQIGARAIIDRSIQFHDSDRILLSKEVAFHLTETRPNGSDRKTVVTIDYSKEYYNIQRIIEGEEITMQWDKGATSFWFNGSQTYSEEVAEKYNLNDAYISRMKDYYRYLWFLPSTLLDPGTLVDDEVQRADFFGKKALSVKVTYEENVGQDIWYFYFHPEYYNLIGYRFYHDEAINDGEYIILDEITENQQLRLPRHRQWYTHKDEKFLGADILDQIVIK